MTDLLAIWTVIEKLLLASVLGGVIGIERGESNTPAGLRTNMIIAISTCLFTVLFLTVYSANHGEHTLIAHIVSGVGFLGAGAIFHDKSQTKGLTTAATIWLVAGIGMATGLGQYLAAIIVTVIALGILHFLEPISAHLNEIGLEHQRAALKKVRKPHAVRKR